MRRREFITLLGGTAVACPLGARAQQGERVRRIGVLVSGAENDVEMQGRLAGFRQGLERFNWLDGRNVRVDYRFAAADAANESIAEADSRNPDCV
jgi:putative ABC transport system substrate-binding protein